MSIEEVFTEYQKSLVSILNQLEEIEGYWQRIEADNFNDVDTSNASQVSALYQDMRFNRLPTAKCQLDKLLSMDINEEVIPEMERFYNSVEQKLLDFVPTFMACNSFMADPRGFRRRNGIVNKSCGTIHVQARRYK